VRTATILEVFDEFGVDPDEVSESGGSEEIAMAGEAQSHSVSYRRFYYICVSIDGSRTTQPSLKIHLPPRKAAVLPTSTDPNESDVHVFLPLNVLFYTNYSHLSLAEQLPESWRRSRLPPCQFGG
jgi:hypothetical protein